MKTSVTSRQPLFSGKMRKEKTHIAREGRPTGTDVNWDQRCARNDDKAVRKHTESVSTFPSGAYKLATII